MGLSILISAVTAEFGPYRERVRALLTRRDIDVKIQEDFENFGGLLIEHLDAYVRSCDAVIHLIGSSQGFLLKNESRQWLRERLTATNASVPGFREALDGGEPLSFTQAEAWLALIHRKPLYLFRPRTGAERAAGFQPAADEAAAQALHRKRLEDLERVVGVEFDNPDHLAALVASSVLLDLAPGSNRQPEAAHLGEWLSAEGLSRDPEEPASPGDFVRRRDVLGRQPAWRLLRAGLYAPRADLLDELFAVATRWLDELDARPTRLPTLWLTGRSGDGKSVLLLQLVARLLLARRDLRVFRTASAERLLEVLEAMAGSTPTLLVVDDLHKVLATIDFPERLDALLERGLDNIAVLACAPTPEFEGFKAACRDQVDTASWTVPPLDADGRSALARWLGIMPDRGAGSPHELLVEFLFELKVGEPIAAFASNFRERLEAQGAYAIVQPIMIATSLDTPAARALLPDGDAAGFVRRLSDEDQGHFDFDTGLPSGQAGVRFTHAQIAWRVFTAWWHDPLRHQPIARAVADGLVPAIAAVSAEAVDVQALVMGFIRRYPRLAESLPGASETAAVVSLLSERLRKDPAAWCWVVAGLLPEQAKAEIADHGLIEEARRLAIDPRVPVIGRCRLAVGAMIASALPSYASEAGAVRRWVGDVLLDPANVDSSAGAIVFLLHRLERNPDVSRWSLAWLEKNPRHESVPALAQVAGGGIRSRPELIPLLVDWLRLPSAHRGSEVAAVTLLGATPRMDRETCTQAIDACIACLARSMGERARYSVMGSLLSVLRAAEVTQRERILATAFAWLGEPSSDRPEILEMLPALVGALDDIAEDDRERVFDHVFRWLRDSPLAQEMAHTVLTPLISNTARLSPARLPEAAGLALTWLGPQRPPRRGSGYVLAPLLALLAELDEQQQAKVVDAALVWLGPTESNPPGSHDVLRNLLTALPRLEAEKRRTIIDYTFTWLAGVNARQRGAHEVIRALLSARSFAGDRADEVIDFSLTWLGDPLHPGSVRAGAQVVFSSLATAIADDDVPRRARAAAWAVAWLGANPRASGSETVAAALCYFAHENQAARTAIGLWAIQADATQLDSFFPNAHPLGPDPVIRRIAENALDVTGDNWRRGSLLVWLLQVYPHDAAIVELGLAHLRQPHARLASRICAFWLGRSEQPVLVIQHLLAALAEVRMAGRPAVLPGAVANAFALNQARVFEALPAFDAKAQRTLMSQLRVGVSRLAPAARVLFEKMSDWPDAHKGLLFRGLLESTMPTSVFQSELTDWLADPATKRSATQPVVIALANRSDRFAMLERSLPSAINQRVATVRRHRRGERIQSGGLGRLPKREGV